MATRLDAISGFFVAGVVISGIIAGGSLLAILLSSAFAESDSELEWNEKHHPKLRPWRKWGLISTGIFALFIALTPSRKDAMFIAGGVGVIEAAKAVAGSEIAKKSVAIIEQWLANNLTELQQEREKSNGRKK